MSESGLALLSTHSWPGNVRELQNVLESAAVLASTATIEADDLRIARSTASGDAAFDDGSNLAFGAAKKRAVLKFEKAFLLRALREHDGNISRAAESVGMVRQSLQQKIRELGLRSEDWTNGSNEE